MAFTDGRSDRIRSGEAIVSFDRVPQCCSQELDTPTRENLRDSRGEHAQTISPDPMIIHLGIHSSHISGDDIDVDVASTHAVLHLVQCVNTSTTSYRDN